MSIVFNEHKLNDIYFNGVKTTGMFNNEKLWPISGMLYENNNIFTANSSRNEIFYNNLPLTGWNYFVLTYKHLASGDVADYSYNRFNNSLIWRLRWHKYSNVNGKPIRDGDTFTAQNPNTVSNVQDNRTIWYYTQIPNSAEATFKLVIPYDNKIASAYWNNTYMGYGSLAGVTSFSSTWLGTDAGGFITVKDIKIGGFDNLQDAQNWN